MVGSAYRPMSPSPTERSHSHWTRPLLEDKFERAVTVRFSARKANRIMATCRDSGLLPAAGVPEITD